MRTVLFNDIYQIFLSFCMLCMVAFCQSVLLKRDDDDDDDDMCYQPLRSLQSFTILGR